MRSAHVLLQQMLRPTKESEGQWLDKGGQGWMLVGYGRVAHRKRPRGQGALLAWLVETLRVARAVEVGVFTGYSALAVALVWRPNLNVYRTPHLWLALSGALTLNLILLRLRGRAGQRPLARSCHASCSCTPHGFSRIDGHRRLLPVRQAMPAAGWPDHTRLRALTCDHEWGLLPAGAAGGRSPGGVRHRR